MGWTPLHLAAYSSIAERCGCECNNSVWFFKGMTPLDWAIRYNHPETTDLLRKHGGKTGEELKAAGN